MSKRFTRGLQLILILFIPIMIITTAVNILVTDQYLTFEYRKASFPPDPFGFTSRQRFIFASTNIHYVRAHLPNDELSKQVLNGIPLYTPREVSHMADVQSVFRFIFRLWKVTFIFLVLIGFILWQQKERWILGSGLQWGGIVTCLIIVLIGLVAVFAWQSWFESFHLLFFQPGSWLFSYSDTLIRLFPMQFWFDATMTITVLSMIGGLVTTLIGWRGRMLLGDVTQAHSS